MTMFLISIGVATMQELNKDDEDDLDTREQEDTDYKERQKRRRISR